MIPICPPGIHAGAHLEIGGGHPQGLVIGLEQDVGEDG